MKRVAAGSAVAAAAALAVVLGAAVAVAAATPAPEEFARGLAAMSRGDLDEAARRFQKVLESDPDSFEAHNNLAVIHAEKGDLDAALIEMRRVVELRPDYYRGRKNLAELYARLAHRSFLAAAEVAPEGDREQLAARARLMGAPGGGGTRGAIAGGTLEPAKAAEGVAASAPAAPAVPPKEEPAPPAAPAPAAAAAGPVVGVDVAPAELVSLPVGVPGIALSSVAFRLFRRASGELAPAERIGVKQAPSLPESPVLYVAVPAADRIDFVPLDRGQKPLAVRAAGVGGRDLIIEAATLDNLRNAVKPYLTPVVAGAALRPRDAAASEAEAAAVLAAFQAWARSWQEKNLDGYLGSYVADYNPRGGPGHAKWREQRRGVFERSGDITITLEDPILLRHEGTIVALTAQEYRSKLQSSAGVKRLTWSPTPQGWKISLEEMLSEKRL